MGGVESVPELTGRLVKLREVHSVVDLGKWMQERGFSPGEHPKFGGVHNVHTDGSLHYGGASNEQERAAKNLPGLALDVNDRDVSDTVKGQFDSESDSLKWLYGRILGIAEALDWPLDEMFFANWGYIKERGYANNHAIGGHTGHLHVGFTKPRWD